MSKVFPALRSPEVSIAIQFEKLLQRHFGELPWRLNKQIHERTGLKRAKIRALRNNEVKSISIDTLQRIIGYLASECHMSPTELLGTFFGILPSGFWTMFAGPARKNCKVHLCQGVRHDSLTPEPRWVNAFDAYLSATFVRHLVAQAESYQPDLEMELFRAYSRQQQKQEAFAEAQDFYRRFRQGGGSRALVCIGSMKSLPLCECVLAGAFGATPFTPPDSPQKLGGRKIPVFFRYRQDDPHPPSAFGGRDLSLPTANGLAGVAYEVDQEHWEFCPATETEDVGMVFYVCRPPQDTVELVLAGFSGRATGCIALGLPELANQLWPPAYEDGQVMIGAFILRYNFPAPAARQGDAHPILVEPSTTEVIPLSRNVLARRLACVAAASSAPLAVPQQPKKARRRKPR